MEKKELIFLFHYFYLLVWLVLSLISTDICTIYALDIEPDIGLLAWHNRDKCFDFSFSPNIWSKFQSVQGIFLMVNNCAHCTHAKSLQMLKYCRKPSGKHLFNCDLFLKTAKNLSVSTCVHPSSLFAKLMLLHKQIQDVATSKPPLTLIEVGFYRRAVYCVCFILRHLCCFILHHLCMYGCDVPYLLPVTLSLFSLFLKNIWQRWQNGMCSCSICSCQQNVKSFQTIY